MEKVKNAVRDQAKASFVGFGVGVLLMLAFILFDRLNNPIPYRDVHIIEQWRDGDWLHLTATFIKTDCQFRQLVINGVSLGVPSGPLPFHDRYKEQGDRIKGKESLRINIGGAFEFDKVIIRTRHYCEGSGNVDKVFAEIDPDIEIKPPVTVSGHGGHLGPAQRKGE